MKNKLNYFLCKKCNHQWIPRIEDVRVCPSCHSYRWNTDKKEKHNA